MRTLTVAEARALDTDAVERLGMPSILLMENASRAVATEAARLGDAFVVLCGPGNNGGDGLAAARHLGLAARVFLLADPDPARSPDAALQLRMLERAGWRVERGSPANAPRDAVWIDALFGTGLARGLEGRAADWVEVLNGAIGPKIACDVPSGLDADSGEPLGPAVRADATVTFEAPKRGLVRPAAAPFVGRIVVASLGIPADRA